MRKIWFVILLAVAVSGCGPRRYKDRVYKDGKGHLYTRTHDSHNNDFIWWMYADTPSSTTTWIKVATPPVNLVPTSKVVISEEEEAPETEMTDSTEASVDATTTEASMDAADASDGGADGGGDGGGGGD